MIWCDVFLWKLCNFVTNWIELIKFKGSYWWKWHNTNIYINEPKLPIWFGNNEENFLTHVHRENIVHSLFCGRYTFLTRSVHDIWKHKCRAYNISIHRCYADVGSVLILRHSSIRGGNQCLLSSRCKYRRPVASPRIDHARFGRNQ